MVRSWEMLVSCTCTTVRAYLTTWKDGSANRSGMDIACMHMCVSACTEFLYHSSLVNSKDGKGTAESRLLPTEKSKLTSR